MSKLGVNIDHVATLREARKVSYPSPVEAAIIAEKAGADQITIHLREDRRHIQDNDLIAIRKKVNVPLNLELAVDEEIVSIACSAGPNICTFVPERREELTTEGGLDVVKKFDRLRKFVKLLKDRSITVSMFIEPVEGQISASRECGADSIELHTGKYCELTGKDDIREELDRLRRSAIVAKEAGLYVAAGHGLNYENTREVVKSIPEIAEYNIGHSIIARAVFVGLDTAVREMKKILGGANI